MKNNGKILSIVIPVYNERQTLPQLLAKVEAVSLPAGLSKELILVDDGSTDGSREFLTSLAARYRVILQADNQGKGAAIRRGFAEVSGDYVIIQDSDLELDPSDYNLLLEPILRGSHDVVFGNRFNPRNMPQLKYPSNYWGVKLISWFSRLLNGQKLHDIYVGYKLFTRPALEAIKPRLISNGFAIETELTARASKFRIGEVPISYFPRSYAAGKKIRWLDGLRGLWATFYFNLIAR